MTPASSRMKAMRSFGKAGVERDVGGADLQHRQQRDVGSGWTCRTGAPMRSPGLQAVLEQIARRLIGAVVELAKGERRILGDDRQMIRRQT